MNLKLRINLIISLILALVMLLGAGLMIDNAREDIRAEVDSTTVLALHLLDAEVSQYGSVRKINANKKGEVSLFKLQSLDNIRHLRIEFFDATGKLVDSNRGAPDYNGKPPPAWFQSLVSRVSLTLKPTRRVIALSSMPIGELVITPDPSYEIAEIWHDTFGLFGLGFLFFLIVNAVLYWAVGSALKPLNKILGALTEIEYGQLSTRLPTFSLPELSNVSHKFNAMAQTLETSMYRNSSLTQQMIRLQEDERKNIAQDLHDEIGQHITAINLDASVILNANDIKLAHQSATAISEVAMQMMGIVREMLHRLRPVILDELGLRSALYELIDSWGQRNQDVSVNAIIDDDLENINEAAAITIYRIVQECLTNVTKHAQADLVTIMLTQHNQQLYLQLQDNGQGFAKAIHGQGFGLIGIRERVEGLGGKLTVSSTATGLTVMVDLPIYFKGMP